jgi:hypothetical protein
VPDDNFSPEFYERWEHLINSVEVTDVPMRLIREINVTFNDANSVVFDVEQMLSHGHNPAEIEECIEDFLESHAETIANVDFHINITALASEVEHKTNKLLDRD